MSLPAHALKRVVVKLGTGVLTSGIGLLDTGRIADVCAGIAALRAAGTEVIIVSSGAVGLGMGRLGLKRRPTQLEKKQACAAIGQSLLMQTWQRGFEPHHATVAQVLLTHEDVRGRERHLAVKATLAALLAYQTIPVQQENGLAETGVYDVATIAAMKTNNKPVQNVNKAINLTKQARLAAAKRTGTSGTANAVTGGPATNSNSTGAPATNSNSTSARVVPQEKPVILSIESLNDQLIQKFPKHFTKAFTNGYRVTFGSPATDKNIYVALKRLLMTPAVNVDEDELLSVFRQLSKNQLATFFKEYKNVNNSELYFDLEDTTFNSGEMTSLRDIARSKGLSFAAEDYSIVYKSSDGNYYVF